MDHARQIQTHDLKIVGQNYERIDTHVDYLLIASKDLQNIVDALVSNRHFELKCTGTMSYYLGCDFGRNEDGALHVAPRKHI